MSPLHRAATVPLVKDIDTPADKDGIDLDRFVGSTIAALGNTIYFAADDGEIGRSLWKSDGTDAGTVLVKDLSGDSAFTLRPVAMNGAIYFVTDHPTTKLWRSDGSSDGTVVIEALAQTSILITCDQVALDTTLFFAGDDGSSGEELGGRTGPLRDKDRQRHEHGTRQSNPQQLPRLATTSTFEQRLPTAATSCGSRTAQGSAPFGERHHRRSVVIASEQLRGDGRQDLLRCERN